ncbi:gas vesicle structural protein GvpA [Thermoleophilia bacterium SCSIO 60948]|nr:gas vesicle structural protein GvpA [Thermoleophilia bacterium SCSIO 60948]
MATGVQPYRGSGGGGGNYVARSNSSGLYDVLELILDKGLVIDVFVRVSLVGIELLTIDARIVIASVDTYLRFAEAVNRLDLNAGTSDKKDLPGVLSGATEGAASSKTKGALQGAKESLFGSDDDDDDDGDAREKSGSRSGSGSRSSSGTRRRKSSS